MNSYTKEAQLDQKPKDKKVPFGMRKNKGSFGKKPSTPLKRTRIKPKPQKIEKIDREYLNWVHLQGYGCLICGTHNQIEWHHIKEYSSDKKNHRELLPLCAYHHRLGTDISAHSNAKAFKAKFPMDLQREIAKKIYEQFLKER